MSGRAAVFIDKDGTLVPDIPFNVCPERIELSAGAAGGLRLLHRAGFPLVIVSNQSGVARGHFAEEQLVGVRRRIEHLMAEIGVPLAAFYYCPHHPEGVVPRFAIACECRKPKPGMFQQAARELNLDLQRSWMIGDIRDDIEAAHLAGCRAVLLRGAGETKSELSAIRQPDAAARDFEEAAIIIVESRWIEATGPNQKNGDIASAARNRGAICASAKEACNG
ncbi:MAG TPA: HAD family hydrolase [Pirellulales bacterium]|nr:HAD family hydrolase [Pirellulales bacterium]